MPLPQSAATCRLAWRDVPDTNDLMVRVQCGGRRSWSTRVSEENTTPSTAVIFQAPEPVAAPTRSRRASAPAGPPKTDDAASSSADAPAKPARKKAAPKKKADAGDSAEAAPAESGEAPAKKAPAKKTAAKKTSAKKADADSAPSEAAAAAAPGEGAEAAPASGEGAEGGEEGTAPRRRRRRGGRGRGKKSGAANAQASDEDATESEGDEVAEGEAASGDEEEGEGGSRRRRRSRGSRSSSAAATEDQLQGSTRLQAKRQRRRDSRDGQRRRPVISEAEFLARRESVKRSMVVREKDGRVQIAVLEDDVLVEHYVSNQAQQSMAGNVYLGRVQNVLPGMEAAFVDVGRGRNAVLYAGEVNWDAAGLEGKPRRIELALKPGDTVMVQVTKDPIGHKGARVTSQISLAGRFLVYVPGGGVTGISRKLPDTERARLKKLLREVIPPDAGVIVRTAAEGASEEELRADVERLKRQWQTIEDEAKTGKAPKLLRGEPDMAIRVVRDIFNEDFDSLTIQGEDTWNSLSAYVSQVAPDLLPRLHKFVGDRDVFAESRIDEQLAKGMDRKVWLPSGGSLVIDRTGCPRVDRSSSTAPRR